MVPIVELGRRKYEEGGDGGGYKNINHRPPHSSILRDFRLRKRLSTEAIGEIVVKMKEVRVGEDGEWSTVR